MSNKIICSITKNANQTAYVSEINQVKLDIQSLLSGDLLPSDVIGVDNLKTERWLKDSTDIQFVSVFLHSRAHDLLNRLDLRGANKPFAVVALANTDGSLFVSQQQALVSDVFATAKILTRGGLYFDTPYRVEIEPLFDGFVITLY